MKKILLIISSLLSFQITIAQVLAPDIEWQNTIGGTNQDFLTSVVQTSDGGYIVGGFSKSNISNDKSENNRGTDATSDYWVVKIDKFGEVMWDKTIGGDKDDFLRGIVQTDDDGYLLAGSSISGNSGDKSEEVIGNHVRDDFWIVRLNEQGDILWDKTLGGDGFDWLNVIQKTQDGGFVLGGTSWWDYSIIKIDSLGNINWWKTFGRVANDYLYSVYQTMDRGYILGGYSENIGSAADYWIIKLDEMGNKIWDKTIGGSNNDYLYSVQQTIDGGYILGGTSSSRISGDKIESQKGWAYWVVKVNYLGDIVWQNTIGGIVHSNDWLKNVQQVSDGGYILGGYTTLGVSGDKTEESRGSNDYWIVKIDSIGQIVWDKTIGGSDWDEIANVWQTNDGGYIIGGFSSSGLSGDKTEDKLGLRDYWVVKLFPDSTRRTEHSLITNIFKLYPAYPNPFNPKITIRYSLIKDSEVNVTIYDLSGKLITTLQNEYKIGGEYSITWDGIDDKGNRACAGVYFYQLDANGIVAAKKMVLIK